MKFAISTLLSLLFVPSLQAQSITTHSEFQKAWKTCSDDWVCIHDAYKSAFPPSQNIFRASGPWYFIGLQQAGAKAAIQIGPDAGIAVLNETIEMVEQFYGKSSTEPYVTASSHLYRAEACLDAEQIRCFSESTDFLLEREVAMRGRRGEPVSIAGVRWSEIKGQRFDKWAHSYFEDEWVPVMKSDPRGTDFRARIDRVLTIAEDRRF